LIQLIHVYITKQLTKNRIHIFEHFFAYLWMMLKNKPCQPKWLDCSSSLRKKLIHVSAIFSHRFSFRQRQELNFIQPFLIFFQHFILRTATRNWGRLHFVIINSLSWIINADRIINAAVDRKIKERYICMYIDRKTHVNIDRKIKERYICT
jgi:hypothetical protein